MDSFKVKVEQVEKALISVGKKNWRSTYYRSRRNLILRLAKEGASYREIIQYFKDNGLSAPSSATIARATKTQTEVKVIPLAIDAPPRNVEIVQSPSKSQNASRFAPIPPMPPTPPGDQPFVFRKGIDDKLPEEILHYVQSGSKIPDEICLKHGIQPP